MKDAEKGQTVGVYFSAGTLDAGRAFSRKTAVPFSRIVETALRAHLEANGALPKPEDDRLSRAQAQLAEVMSVEEMEAEIARRTAATVSGEVVLVP